MSAADTAETDFWHVQLLNGEVRYWSLDELDEAFQRGDVDGTTFVLKQGDTAWVRLGELLGLDEAESAPAPAAYASVAPAALQVDTAPVWSIRPVVADLDVPSPLDLDDDLVALKPKRKKVIVMAAGAAAVLMLGIAAVSSAGGGDAKAAAAAPPPPPVVAPPPPVVDTPAPAPVLSDDMKKSLLAADKSRATKAAEKAADRAKSRAVSASHAGYRTPKSGQVFHAGGNKYDPLNSQE
jgi:hypothetical protein